MASIDSHRALHNTSPPSESRNASLISTNWCNLLRVLTTATSPISKGLITHCALLPVHSRWISVVSMKMRLDGFEMSSMFIRIGRSSRYFKSAHIMRFDSGAVCQAIGSGTERVPRVIELIKPARRRTFRMPRFWTVCGTATWARRARNAFCIRAQRSWGRGMSCRDEVEVVRKARLKQSGSTCLPAIAFRDLDLV
jgi:hypothetical protein